MIMLRRRSLGGLALGAGICGWQSSRANPLPPDKALRFSIARNGCEIGSHDLRFEQKGDDLVVSIDVHMRVGFGPLTFFRYHHQGEERWHGGQFVSLTTETDDNGEPLRLQAQRDGDRIQIQATKSAPHSLPGDALPLTHWNVACMRTKLFNPQDGTVLQEESQSRGSEMVALANGQRVQATRYALAGKAPIDDWYDKMQVWTALRATVKDGSVLLYTRQT